MVSSISILPLSTSSDVNSMTEFENVSPAGMEKLKTAAPELPAFVTEACDPAIASSYRANRYCRQRCQCSPFGIVKFRTRAFSVPAFSTEAEVPAAPVVTVPAETVAAVPSAMMSVQ